MVEQPEDREQAAREVIEAAEGRLLAFYWMLGEHDGLAIYEVPSATAAAAISAATAASGRIADLETGAPAQQLRGSRRPRPREGHRGLVQAPGRALGELAGGLRRLGVRFGRTTPAPMWGTEPVTVRQTAECPGSAGAPWPDSSSTSGKGFHPARRAGSLA